MDQIGADQKIVTDKEIRPDKEIKAEKEIMIGEYKTEEYKSNKDYAEV